MAQRAKAGAGGREKIRSNRFSQNKASSSCCELRLSERSGSAPFGGEGYARREPQQSTWAINMSDRPKNLLHIDDDPDILRLVAAKLQARGYQVHSLDDPCQAQRELLSRDCRVVLLDVDMPTMNGLELLRQIKEYDGGIQVILLTGLVSMNTVLESMRMGAEACLFKPICDFDQLYHTLDATYAKVDRWWRTLQDLTHRAHSHAAPDATVVG